MASRIAFLSALTSALECIRVRHVWYRTGFLKNVIISRRDGGGGGTKQYKCHKMSNMDHKRKLCQPNERVEQYGTNPNTIYNGFSRKYKDDSAEFSLMRA
jgi:hypothetical protein